MDKLSHLPQTHSTFHSGVFVILSGHICVPVHISMSVFNTKVIRKLERNEMGGLQRQVLEKSQALMRGEHFENPLAP